MDVPKGHGIISQRILSQDDWKDGVMQMASTLNTFNEIYRHEYLLLARPNLLFGYPNLASKAPCWENHFLTRNTGKTPVRKGLYLSA